MEHDGTPTQWWMFVLFLLEQSFVSSTYDKQGRSHQMFKLLSQYPDIVLDKAVDSLKADGVVVYNKVSDTHPTPPTQQYRFDKVDIVKCVH